MKRIVVQFSKNASEIGDASVPSCMRTSHKTTCWAGRTMAAAIAAAAITAASPCAAEEGETFYRTNCSSCHGDHAKGDGKMAALLTTKAADLTSLAATNGGLFPSARVIRQIDGSELVESHGTPKPIWTKRLRANTSMVVSTDEGDVEVAPTVAELITWLESIQR
ncbi:cytochrome c [Tropicimonas sp. TH_r6]|uniref:c-type cytochrome n=1 Tax=Tropicimonas sp. TH_r6 TaxID=3082085 RepID=UPI002952D2E2|nr:c-type cytochrome [Tropicimonas sp. TH_r6]MDV7144274.1 cytochrome c [Tropicimonas sp. TH_r6]